jgi:hypothetical protein
LPRLLLIFLQLLAVLAVADVPTIDVLSVPGPQPPPLSGIQLQYFLRVAMLFDVVCIPAVAGIPAVSGIPSNAVVFMQSDYQTTTIGLTFLSTIRLSRLLTIETTNKRNYRIKAFNL